jgi:hypothetical protein
MTTCGYSSETMAALEPAANIAELSRRGVITLLMRGNQVRSLERRATWTKVHVLTGRRAGSDCWLSVESVDWEGKHVRGRGVVEPGTVCLDKPEEFDERFFLPGCCRDAAYREAVNAKRKLAGPVRAIDGAMVQVRPAPYEIYVSRVTGKLLNGTEAACWIPVHIVDPDDPDDFATP